MGVAVQKNLVKQYVQKDQHNRDQVRCFLKNNTQFEIYLKNHRKVPVIVKLEINGKNQGQGLLLQGLEALFLDKFLTNNKKLIFKTYDSFNMSQEVQEIIKQKTNIGKISINVYSIRSVYDSSINTGNLDYNYYQNCFTTGSRLFYGSGSCDMVYNPDKMIITPSLKPSTPKGGAIEGGKLSDQQYDVECDWEISSLLESYDLHIYDLSSRVVNEQNEQVDEINKVAVYCSACGRRQRANEKFCPADGTKY